MAEPFFSIIVVSLNAEEYIEKTIRSIEIQTYKDFEVIVKDGFSHDNTLAFVPTEDKRFHIYQIPDKSLYEAMNQAIEKTKGKYLIFMNCGDTFANSAVLEEIRSAIGNKNYSFFYGDYYRDGILHKQPHNLTAFSIYRTPLCHQTVFFNGNVLRDGAIYNLQYTILADYDLELRLIQEGEIGHLPIVVCDYLGGGISETKAGIKRKKSERIRIVRSTFSPKQRLIFGIKYHASMPKLRTFIMYSEKTPKFIKKIYQSVVNGING